MWCRHGKYKYAKGTTSIIEEQVKHVGDDADEMMTTPMQYEVVEVSH